MPEMTRDDLKSFFYESYKLEESLEELPYRLAKPAMDALKAMREIVGEQLPGGCYGICMGCDEIRGEDEMVGAGDERLCSDCFDRMAKEENAA